MSEPGPESIPTSADPRSKRPIKRRAVSPRSEQATEVHTLFRDPSKEIRLPQPSKPLTSASLPPPPEIVANVQGSSAGAGSGEFHVYKASRQREYKRLQLMQNEMDKEKADAEWESKRDNAKRKDEEKTDKNRRKREKRKAAKSKGGGGGGGMLVGGQAKASSNLRVNGAGKDASEEQVADSAQAFATVDEEPGVVIHED